MNSFRRLVLRSAPSTDWGMACVLGLVLGGAACSSPSSSSDGAGGVPGVGGFASGGTGNVTQTTGGSVGTTGGSGGATGSGGDVTGPPPPIVTDDEPVAPLQLIPVPVSAQVGAGHLHLTNDTRLVAPASAHPVAELLAVVLRGSTGLAFPVVEAPERQGDIVFVIDPAAGGLGEEGYRLEVTEDRTRITATTHAGLYYGTITLRQLLPESIEAVTPTTATWRLPRVSIEDSPRFPWRGLSFDVARHFFGVEEIRRLIDLAAYHKLNRLHLHLTDDQGWRIFIDSWPNLATHGGSTQVGGGPGGYFTKEDYGSLVSYAAERFITVVPEIDMPGHTNAALASYGELNPGGNPTSLYTGTEVGFSSLWLGQQVTMDFVDDVLGEMAAMTPGPYLHIGGDEAHESDHGQYLTFIDQVEGIVHKHGKTMVGWCEVGEAAIGSTTIVQEWYRDWETCNGTGSAVSKGAKVIFSPAEHAYLDMKYEESTPWGHDWAGHVSVQQAYEWQPSRPEVPAANVLGVEAAVWTEFIDDRQAIDRMVFPRLCGHAEIGWSPAEGRNFQEYKGRLARHGKRLTALGVDYYRSPLITWE